MGIIGLFTTLFSLGALSVIACEWITNQWTKASGTWAQIQSWAVSVVIGISCSWLGFGIFKDVSIMGGILYGVLIGLISNGIFDMALVKKILEMIKLRVGTMGNDKLIKS